MLLVTTDSIPGKELEVLSLVKGSTVQAKNIGRDFMSGLKGIVGGEITAYTEMMDEARAIATKRMMDEAAGLGADAIVCVRYASSSVMQGASEVMAYGTAVRYK
ncbi:YbjQ family protein [Angelakisella massiliensis]|uniref:YbjQ family protein n=1 Tax=Angelakisella massiliensis TaxID=1871018 RepID=UPI0008F95E79|nr:YbjQ family protein [Angelakisella massiliensis]